MHSHSKTRATAGSALIFSVLSVLIVSVLAATFLQLALSVTRRLGAASDTHQAFNLAEAGLAEAYTGLAAARTGDVGSADTPSFFGGGLLWVEATNHAGGLVELECTAMYGTGRATLGLVCEPVETRIAALGFFTTEDLRLSPDIRLDSYDSSRGTYAEQVNTPLNNQGVVGSNGDVKVASGSLIFGDVIHGPTGSADVATGSVVTGGVSPRPELEALPSIEVPSIALAAPVVHSSGTPMVVPSGEAGFESLTVGKNGKLVLLGPLTMVVGTLSLEAGSELVLDTRDGPVELFLTESLDQDMGSLVTTTTSVPSDCLVFVAAPEKNNVHFGAKSQFHGFLYAPGSRLQIAAQFEIFGGVVCRELQLAANGKMHYDRGLGATLQARLPMLRSWRVVDLPREAAVKRTDPFRLRELDPRALPSPTEAHKDQLLEVRYLDSGGTERSYSGQESAFDWNDVKQLIYGLRDGEAFFLPDGELEPAARNPLLDLVSSTLSSKDLRDELLAASPVPGDVIAAACARVPPMSMSDLKNVLDTNRPLDKQSLLASILSSALDSSTLKSVLIDNSPLPLEVLTAVLTRSPPLSALDLIGVLAKQ